MNIFDIIGPVMVGPSSSHTAGAVKIGQISRKLMDEEIRKEILTIEKKTDLKVLVSLSCTMCPELVTAAQRIASLNPNVTAEVYDLNHFPALKEQYQVMSVPCLVINNGEKISFGKKNVKQLLEFL